MIPFEPLWKKHRADVEGIARRISRGFGGQDEYDQLVAAGMCALWKKSLDYDESLGTNPWTHAFLRVQGAMYDELRQLDRITRSARHALKAHDGVVKASWGLLQAHDLEAARHVAAQGDPEEILQDKERVTSVWTVLGTLPPVERAVISDTYLGTRTLREVGDELGISESRACQIRRQAVQKMREYLASYR